MMKMLFLAGVLTSALVMNAKAQESGFTVAGPYYDAFASSKATVERAAALGMRVAAQLEAPPALRFKKGEDALKSRGARMAALSDEDIKTERWPSVRLLNMAYDKDHFLILVNSADKPVRARLSGMPGNAKPTMVSGSDAAKLKTSEDGLNVTLARLSLLARLLLLDSKTV